MAGKRLVARVGTYTDREGKEKGEYVNIGVILSNDNGEYALIDPCVSLAGVLMKQRALAHADGRKMMDKVSAGIYSDDKPAEKPRARAEEVSDDDIPF